MRIQLTAKIGVTVVTLLVNWLLVVGQAPSDAERNDEEVRNLWDTTFIGQRPPGKNSANSAQHASTQKEPTSDFFGITVWRLRPTRSTDPSGVRMLLHEEDHDSEWTPERIDANKPIVNGQRIRLAIETTRKGYIYVVDREKYEDGSYGDPMLIFPTTRIRDGCNEVSAGRVIELPSWNDRPPYYTLRFTRRDQVGDALTILVSPRRLLELGIGPTPLKLGNNQLQEWAKKWAVPFKCLGSKQQVGLSYTTAEKEAAQGAHPLTADDPTPQTIYQVDGKPEDPFLLNIVLSTRP